MDKMGWWIAMDLMSGSAVPGGAKRRRRRRRKRRAEAEAAAANAQAEQATRVQAAPVEFRPEDAKPLIWLLLPFIVWIGVLAPYRLGTSENWIGSSTFWLWLQISCGVLVFYGALRLLGWPKSDWKKVSWAFGLFWVATFAVFVAYRAGLIQV